MLWFCPVPGPKGHTAEWAEMENPISLAMLKLRSKKQREKESERASEPGTEGIGNISAFLLCILYSLCQCECQLEVPRLPWSIKHGELLGKNFVSFLFPRLLWSHLCCLYKCDQQPFACQMRTDVYLARVLKASHQLLKQLIRRDKKERGANVTV